MGPIIPTRSAVGGRLAPRLVGATLFVLAVGIASAGRVLISHSRLELSEQIDRQGRALARASAAHCLDPVLSRDYPVLDGLALQLVSEGHGVEAFEVEREDGTVVAEARTPDANPESLRTYVEPILLTDEEGEEPPIILGLVRISLSDQVVEISQARQVRTLVLTSVLLFAALSSAIWFLVRLLLGRPLDALNEQLQAVSRDLEHPVELASGGELVRIAAAVEDLRLSVLEGHHVLEDRNRRVELLSNDKDRVLVELEKAIEAAHDANRLKTAFLANTSHEIRTPLNGILGLAHLLQGRVVDEQSEEWLGTLQHSAESLLGIINDVLDISKIEAGEARIETEPLDLHATIEMATRTCAPIAEGKGVQLSYSIDERVPRWVAGDPNGLRQVLLNLVGNATKFTEEGQVSLRVFPTESAEDGPAPGRIRFEVKDSGIGIPADSIESIFEPFRQVDGSMTRQHGGTGLGLAITARLVALMDGDISIESHLGEGSTFYFDLPLPATAAPPEELPKAAIAPRIEGSLRILVVDDNPVNRRVACALLQRRGHQTLEAENGLQAVEVAREERPEVVMMDCQMPLLDGYEATSRIRLAEAAAHTPPVPILAWTANALPEEHEKCLAAGMNGYITKPFKPDDLFAAIAAILPAHGRVS